MKGPHVAFGGAIVFVVLLAVPAVRDLVPGWVVALVAMAGIGLIIWADPLGDATDYDDEEEAA
ncbi:hypothetical protein ABZ799_28795 [Nocardiopsis dassonvillei]|uniref:hypothetical protein n=1 Tax=Nocardiopsis dassonvillei TaxID=2014 RepID=UPI0033C36918